MMDGPRRFRKMPVEIDACQWLPDDSGGANRVADWLNAHDVEWRTEGVGADCVIKLPTLEGEMAVSGGDFIIRGIKGEFYPCKPDIFAATYEAV